MNAIAPVRFRIKGTQVYVQPRAMPRADVEAASVRPRLANWIPANLGPNTLATGGMSMVRSRSRNAVTNDGVALSGLEILVSNIVGTGIRPQFNTADSATNRALADLWDRWTTFADPEGQWDFYGQQQIAVRGLVTAGEIFARLRARLPEDGLPVPLQIQLLESEFCPVEKSQSLANGRYIKSGVEFDQIGRRTAYWLYRQHPSEYAVATVLDNSPVAVPASEVVHLANVPRPGMVRGWPWLTTALVKLYELDKMDDATLVRQQIASMFTGFVSPEGSFMGSAEELANQVAPLASGAIQVLPQGVKMDFFDPPSAGDSYDVFMKHQLRRIAASMGILYEQLSGDYSNVNDRTWRSAINEFKRRLESWQHNMVAFQYCRPILRRWAEYVALARLVRLPAGIGVDQIANAKWLPPVREYINPVQDIQSLRDEVRAGFTSRAQVVSERGYDAEQIDDENARDNERADSMGLTYDSDGRVKMQAGAPQEPAPAPAPQPPVAVHMPPVTMNVPDIINRVEVDLSKAAPPNVHVEVAAPAVRVDAPQAKSRRLKTTVTAHDERGRIKSFIQEDID